MRSGPGSTEVQGAWEADQIKLETLFREVISTGNRICVWSGFPGLHPSARW